jgi:hypothetical protein
LNQRYKDYIWRETGVEEPASKRRKSEATNLTGKSPEMGGIKELLVRAHILPADGEKDLRAARRRRENEKQKVKEAEEKSQRQVLRARHLLTNRKRKPLDLESFMHSFKFSGGQGQPEEGESDE